MTTTTPIPNEIPPPPDARVGDEWLWQGIDRVPYRFFSDAERGTKVRVDIEGWQYADATTHRWIVVHNPGDGDLYAELDADEVDNVIADLLGARNEVQALAD
jgi:hypothetical protein